MVERKLFAPTNDTDWSELAGTVHNEQRFSATNISKNGDTFRSKSRLFWELFWIVLMQLLMLSKSFLIYLNNY